MNQNVSCGGGNSWNTSSGSMGGQESEINGTTGVVGTYYDEASTSTETKQVQRRVECAVQV